MVGPWGWDQDAPADDDIVSQYPANARGRRDAVRQIFDVDHHAAEDSDQGFHDYVTLLQNDEPDAPGEGKSVTYGNNVDGQVVPTTKSQNGTFYAPVPSGGIIMWSGSVEDIPSDWALCDGSNGTPDLRDRFIRGAGGSNDPGDTGGSSDHNHGGTNSTTLSTSQIPSHSHGFENSQSGWNSTNSIGRSNNDGTNSTRFFSSSRSGSGSGVSIANTGGGGSHSHSISNSNHIPPFYSLAFIMKL